LFSFNEKKGTKDSQRILVLLIEYFERRINVKIEKAISSMPFSIEIEASHYSICMLGFLSNKKKMARIKEKELANNMAALC